ncbi:MAG: cytochrome c3 family protein [Candidatus Brocadiales bacterium]|nr:cytochrome c3 family protein [Candidatus Brocadiales bacterium]
MFEEVKRLNKSVAIWLAIISLMSVGIVVGVLFITVAQPKHSQFCAKCHNNISFNNACKKSLSEAIACIECHTHENKGMTVIATEIRDDHCTNDSCHPLTKLSAKPVHYKGLKPFQHKTHLEINLNQITLLSPYQEEVKNSSDEMVFTRENTKDKFIGKLRLRCTSCHANIDGEKHFETDTSTCNACHFISQSASVKSSPASPSSREKNSLCKTENMQQSNNMKNKKFISDCTLCHVHIEKTKEIYGKIFKHDVYEKNEKVSCTDCHFKTIQGDGKVDKKSCYQCHSKIANNFNNASDMHWIHIDKHKTPCTSCHTSITHGWVKANDKIYGDNNTELVDMEYKIQNLIMTGQGGVGVKGEPDPMHLATLNCSACHKDKQLYTNVASEVCNNCHNKGFDKMLSEQMHFVTSKMRLLRTLLVKAKRFHNFHTHAVSQQTIIHGAEVNYNLIKGDGSFGVHNIKYVKDLLDYSIAKLVSVHPPPLTPPTRGGGNFHPLRPRQRGTFPPPVPLTEGDKGGGGRSGGGAELLPKLKQIEGFVASSNKSPFPTSSCIDRCHVNYMAYRTIYQKEIFRHKMHSPDQCLECYQCHNNDPIDKKTHGNLIIQNKDCRTCHHKEANNNDCLKCHSEVKEYINGSIQNIVTKKPDWMSKSVSCTECHKLELDGASFKAVRKYCIECHNPDYGLLYDAWKDVLDSKTKLLYKNNTNTLNIQNPLRLVQSYGVHNFRLSQMLLKYMDHD